MPPSTSLFDVVDPGDEHIDAYLALIRGTTATSPAGWAHYCAIPVENRVALAGDAVVGGVRSELLGQHFGGRAVTTACISGVVVAPVVRSKGYARELFREVLASLRARGVGLATLFPSDSRTYTRLGFGDGGVRFKYAMRTEYFQRVRSETADVEQVDTDAAGLEHAQRCYDAIAPTLPGSLSRTEPWWRYRILPPPGEQLVQTCVVRGQPDAIDGYAIYSLSPGESPWLMINIHDVAWRGDAARAALIAILTSYRAMATAMSWCGPASDGLSLLGRTDQLRVVESRRWMTRLLHLPAALRQRGYDDRLNEELRLRVDDDLLPANAAPLRLTVHHGVGSVEEARDADVELSSPTMASIFTGFLDAGEAARHGLIRGRPEAVDALRRLFGGPAPWMSERY